MTKLIPAAQLFAEWHKDPAYRAAYAALDEEFALLEAMIVARKAAKLTQAQLAARMGTSQAALARLESSGSMPSTRTLQKFAEATGTKLRISFERPVTDRRRAKLSAKPSTEPAAKQASKSVAKGKPAKGVVRKIAAASKRSA